MKSRYLLLSLALTILNSCSGINRISNQNNIAQSYYTESIFLSPEALKNKKLHIYFKNSTTYEDFNLENDITKYYQEKGFEITTPANAHLIMQLNIKYYGIFDRELLNSVIEDTSKKVYITKSINDYELNGRTPHFNTQKKKYDFNISGFIIGGIGGFLIFHNLLGSFISAGVVSIGGSYLNKSFEEKTIISIVDVQVFEKTKSNVKMYELIQIQNPDGSFKKLEISEEGNYKIQQAKIIIASKNINIQDAKAIHNIKIQLLTSMNNIL